MLSRPMNHRPVHSGALILAQPIPASLPEDWPGEPCQAPGAVGQARAHCAILLYENETLLVPGTISAGMLGEQAAQLAGMARKELPAALRALLDAVVRTRTEQLLPELTLPGSEGGTRLLQVVAAPVPGSEERVMLALYEVEDARAFDSGLRQLERLAGMGTLAASLAHEVRNSLVAVKTFVDLLLEQSKDQETAEVVRRELRRGDGLLEQMLRFTGASSRSFVPMHLHTLLDHCLRLLRPRFEKQGLRLERAFEANTDLVNGNEDELQQVIVNLLFNALDAMGEQGTLTLRTQVLRLDSGEHLQLAIKDSGTGIPLNILGRVFDPFFTTKQSGTGLGLAIARRIVQEHSGSITAQSPPGEGAEFLVTLPLLRG
ncbi:MAG TPA: ATP-binding protein [Clostridia bacterium]|nr:ATP-binding protein [Clostridia bacterium]